VARRGGAQDLETEARDGAAFLDESIADITALENTKLVLVEMA
jgi:hypothetical protein